VDFHHKLLLAVAVVLFVATGVVTASWINSREDRIRAEATVKADEQNRKEFADQLKGILDNEKQFHEQQAAAAQQLEAKFQQAQNPAQLQTLLSGIIGKPVVVTIPAADSQNLHPTAIAEAPAIDLKNYAQQCETCKLNLQTKTQELTYAQQQAAIHASDLAKVTQERDSWKTAANGGTTWQRTRKVLKMGICAGLGGAAGGASKNAGAAALGAAGGVLVCSLL
jgi:hypothetical protein